MMMRGYFPLLVVTLICSLHQMVYAQNDMQGKILDHNTKLPVKDVQVLNVHTGDVMVCDEEGVFKMSVTGGNLVEFRKDGYKIIRVRVPEGKLPSYFKVIMQEAGTEVVDYVYARGAAPDYKTDSMRYRRIYGSTLDVPKLTGLDVIRHPFSAMSKKNQQIWAFQDEYKWYQEQKYIDYTFNEDLINKVTGLGGDSLQSYMRMFRPTYKYLRSMNEYAYLNYIKTTVDAYRRRGIRARQPVIRSSQ